MYTLVVILGLVLIVSLVGFAMWCCYRAGWDNGYEQATGDHKDAKHVARHALPRKPAVEAPETAPEPSEDNDWYQPLPGPIQSHTSALSLATPVILPAPGEYKPQAGRDSGPGTVTLDKLTTTGEISVYKARTDKFIADHCS